MPVEIKKKPGLFQTKKHKYRPSDSWWKFKRVLSCRDKPYHLYNVFNEPLEKTYDCLSESALDPHQILAWIPMSLSMYWYRTSVPSSSGMEENKLLRLHRLQLCSSVVVLEIKLISWRKLISQLANIVGRKQEEVIEEFNIQSAGVKKNTDNDDLQ